MTPTVSSTPFPPEPLTGFGLVEVRVRGFRAARDVALAPEPLARAVRLAVALARD